MEKAGEKEEAVSNDFLDFEKHLPFKNSKWKQGLESGERFSI